MATRSSPTVRRRQLGSELRQYREAVGLTIDQVAKDLECSLSKVSRIETGQSGVRPQDLRHLLTLYQATDDQRERSLQLAREARQKSWWHAHTELNQHVRTYIELEVAAASISEFGGLLLPGLLQTREYARAVLSALRPQRSEDKREASVELRLTRQALLKEDDPPSYWAIIDEAALRRRVGGHKVMSEQIKHLIEVATFSNVTLQVLPFTKGEHAGMSGNFTIIKFPEENHQDVVYLEHYAGDLYLDDPADVALHAQAFDYLRAEALAPDESLSALVTMVTAEGD